jgi:hypothetical protein
MKIKGTGILSNELQTRKYDSIVLPADYPAAAASSYAVQSFSAADTTWTSMGIDASVTLSSSTDLVLVLVTAVFNADASSNAKFTIYRNNAEISSGLTLQRVSGLSTSKNRQVTMAYVDEPGSEGTKIYSAMAAKVDAGDGTFSVSEGGRDLRQTIAIVFPPSLLKYATSNTDMMVSSSTWVSVGLSVTVTPFDATDAVLIIVNINFNPDTAGSIGAYTIFQDETNLGHASTGIAYVKTPNAGEKAIASMSYLHLPGTNSAIVYSVRCLAVTGSFTVGANAQTRSIIALIQPQKPPTSAPTADPSFAPTPTPSVAPTPLPTSDPSFAPTTKPTANPTAVPTANPSQLPTLVPTPAPSTPAPTATPDDCRTGCSYAPTLSIMGKTLLKRMQLSSTFTLEFDVTVPVLRTSQEMLGSALPLVELVDSVGNTLLALTLTEQRGTGLIYNGEVLVSYGVNLMSSYTSTYTNFKISVLSSQVRAVASSDGGWTAPYDTSGLVDTTGIIYSLYLSSTTNGGTGGSFRNIMITRKCRKFYRYIHRY